MGSSNNPVGRYCYLDGPTKGEEENILSKVKQLVKWIGTQEAWLQAVMATTKYLLSTY